MGPWLLASYQRRMNELLFGAQSGSGELMIHGSQLFGFTRQIYALSNISKLEKTIKTSVCPLFLLRLPGAPWHRKLMNALFPVSEKEETLRCPFSLVFYSFPIRVNLSAKDMLSPKVSKFYFVVQVKMKPLTSVLNCFFFFFYFFLRGRHRPPYHSLFLPSTSAQHLK